MNKSKFYVQFKAQGCPKSIISIRSETNSFSHCFKPVFLASHWSINCIKGIKPPVKLVSKIPMLETSSLILTILFACVPWYWQQQYDKIIYTKAIDKQYTTIQYTIQFYTFPYHFLIFQAMGCGECALSKYDHVMYDADMFGYNKNLALLNKSSENIRFLT